MTLALLGGLVGLDAVSCPQAMLARPVIAAPLAGLVLGDPASGIWAGVLLELLTLRQLPIGGARYWETGPAAVVAGVAAAGADSVAAGAVAGAAAGVIIAWLGGWSVHALRQLNGRLVADLERQAVPPVRLARRQLAAMGLDFTRAGSLTVAAVSALTLLPVPGADADPAAGLVLLCGAGLALGVDVGTIARGRTVLPAMGVGFLLGALWVWLF